MIFGYNECLLALYGKKVKLLVLATDVSEKTKFFFLNKLEQYEVNYIEFGFKEQLGIRFGKTEIAIIAITDSGLANAIVKLYPQNNL